MHQVSADLSLARPLALADGTHGHRARDAVGALRRRPQVRRGARPGRAGRRRRRRRAGPRALGGRSSRASSPTRPPWPTPWTGWPSSSCSWPTRSATAAAGTTPGWPPWPCSTTTCAPSGRVYLRLGMRRLVTAAEADEAVTEPPPGHPGLVPGQVPGPLARGGGDRQLGFPRLRHRHRPPAPRPYDGSAEGNGRAHRALCWPRAPDRRTCWTGSIPGRT